MDCCAGAGLLPGKAGQAREYQLLAHPVVTELGKELPKQSAEEICIAVSKLHLK